ncbi:hypothetical protein [Ruminococcus sp.]|uniref:hypothetical protein n=1 Tax=Ruminococcus sp. TaxID=41978 RepID=UPI0025D3AE4C|nr:hypothetical protein [Ruminococcus sp.]MBQ9542169.1 hypothetical protein [Ruminococcus sp.]
MGFFVMVFSFFIGVSLIVYGFTYKKKKHRDFIKTFSPITGLAFVALACWLAFPK